MVFGIQSAAGEHPDSACEEQCLVALEQQNLRAALDDVKHRIAATRTAVQIHVGIANHDRLAGPRHAGYGQHEPEKNREGEKLTHPCVHG